ncbi:MAG TPA: amidohydrolase family protein [Flavisolibacter sp.]|nr:amidohydrolase family protein [Flavisolibacter sp.]
MLKVDAHQHFWNYTPERDNWIDDSMAILKRDYLPFDLRKELNNNQIDVSIAVQANQSEEETNYLLSLAEENTFIKGVVGWIDLTYDNVREKLSYYKNFKQLKGFRHILQSEKERDFMLHPAFIKGISYLQEFNYTYDILVYNDQLKYIKQFVSLFPNQKFVLDHLGKPDIRNEDISNWKKDLESLKHHENVLCKISGMVTEADWKNWQKEDFKNYLDVVLDTFGINRIMFGSDWPVCLLAATYAGVVEIVADYFTAFSSSEKEKLFGLNALNFYSINPGS